MFNRNSGLVKIWVNLLSAENSKYTEDDIPDISNLITMVMLVIAEKGKTE